MIHVLTTAKRGFWGWKAMHLAWRPLGKLDTSTYAGDMFRELGSQQQLLCCFVHLSYWQERGDVYLPNCFKPQEVPAVGLNHAV